LSATTTLPGIIADITGESNAPKSQKTRAIQAILRKNHVLARRVLFLTYGAFAVNALRLLGDVTMPGLGTILLIVLILLLLGALPAWPHSRSWGYYPSGGLGLVVIIVLILVLMGRV
jgi:hypothetical protein